MNIPEITKITRTRIASAAVAALLAPAILMTSAVAANAADTGLFGTAKSGSNAYSQSLAIIGITSAVESAPVSSVKWLTKAQCGSGGFTTSGCSKPDPVNYTGPDSNTTAIAVVALVRSGKLSAAKAAGKRLLAWQNTDGGWPYFATGDSDLYSSGLVTYALQTLPDSKKRSAAIDSAQTFMGEQVISCDASLHERNGLPGFIGGTADTLASAQGLLGLASLSARAGKSPAAPGKVNCNSDLTRRIASYLQVTAAANHGPLPSSYAAGETDWTATATAVIALKNAGWAPSAITNMTNSMSRNVDSIIRTRGKLQPGSIGVLMQAATSADRNPMAFGGKNLYSLLLSTLQK